MRVRVGGHHDPERAVPGAVVGLVLWRVDDPLPAELPLKVDGDGPQTAVSLGRVALLSANLKTMVGIGADKEYFALSVVSSFHLVEGPLSPVVHHALPDVQLEEGRLTGGK